MSYVYIESLVYYMIPYYRILLVLPILQHQQAGFAL